MGGSGRLSLHAVCTAIDGAFCEALGTPPSAYTEYRARHQAKASPLPQQQALAVSWLPPSLDLASLVFAEEEGERQLHAAMRPQPQQQGPQTQKGGEEAPKEAGEHTEEAAEEEAEEERRRQAEQRQRGRDGQARALVAQREAERASRAEARRRETSPDTEGAAAGQVDGADFALELPE